MRGPRGRAVGRGSQSAAQRGRNRNPPRNVRECEKGDCGAMLVSPDLCLSGASIAGYQDPVDMCNTSTISKSFIQLINNINTNIR